MRSIFELVRTAETGAVWINGNDPDIGFTALSILSVVCRPGKSHLIWDVYPELFAHFVTN